MDLGQGPAIFWAIRYSCDTVRADLLLQSGAEQQPSANSGSLVSPSEQPRQRKIYGARLRVRQTSIAFLLFIY